MTSITTVKQDLRTQLRAKAAALSPRERRESDQALAERFLALPQVAAAERLLLFWGVGIEPATEGMVRSLLDRGKEVLLPKCLPHRAMEGRLVRDLAALQPGTYGIPEPGGDCPAVEPGRIDLILVPALCCDRRRYRLGQGGGYYDRYLAGYGGVTVSLCRAALLQERLPVEGHDLPVSLVLTERECLSNP